MYEATKRVFDIAVALIGIVLLAPVMGLIALAVKADSSGPVFYRGLRTGIYGQTFYIVKFRSMRVGSDSGAATTSREDKRVTKVGRVLRQYKLDELPQLVNVLRGEMSLVGPRPELPRYTEQYEGVFKRILTVKPGITDFASIAFSDLNSRIDDHDPDGSFERTILPEKNRLRLKYINERSITTDLRILFLTALTVFKHK